MNASEIQSAAVPPPRDSPPCEVHIFNIAIITRISRDGDVRALLYRWAHRKRGLLRITQEVHGRARILMFFSSS